LDLKTKLCLVENDVIEQELKHQVSNSSELERRVSKIESENVELRAKLKLAQEAESSVAKLMHLKSKEYKEVSKQLEDLVLDQQHRSRRLSGGGRRRRINNNNNNNKSAKESVYFSNSLKGGISQGSLVSILSNNNNNNNSKYSFYDVDVNDDENKIARQQLKNNAKERSEKDKRKKESIWKILCSIKQENQDLEMQVREREKLFYLCNHFVLLFYFFFQALLCLTPIHKLFFFSLDKSPEQ
jgi:hypothetical protein